MAKLTWQQTTFVLCTFGLLKELRPTEPFLTEYLISDQGPSLSLHDAYSKVYPVWTYTYLALLIVVFLVTDAVRYKPVIVIESLGYITTWLVLIFGKSVLAMQLMQVAYAVATSTEVAYYVYIYAQVDNVDLFQRISSYTRVAILLGRFASGCLAQLLISFNLMSYMELNYLTLATASLTVPLSLALPSVDKSLYFQQNTTTPTDSAFGDVLKSGFTKLATDFRSAYGQIYVLKWSVWWAIATCGNFQVGNFVQPLWETIVRTTKHDNGDDNGDLTIYNGATEAVSTLCGASMAFILGFVHTERQIISDLILAFISLANGGLLMIMATTESIWTCYGCYILFRSLFQMIITVASFEVARHIQRNTYGLVFGFNTFLALLLQTVLTVVVVDSGLGGLALEPRGQFEVYSYTWLASAALFVVFFIISIMFRSGHIRQIFTSYSCSERPLEALDVSQGVQNFGIMTPPVE